MPGRLWHGLCSLFDSSTRRSLSESQDITNIENIEFVDTSDEDDVFENTYANIDHLKQPAKPEPIYATVKKKFKLSPKVKHKEKNVTVEQKKASPAASKKAVVAAASSVKQPAPQEPPQPPAAEVATQDSEEGMEAMSGLYPVMVPLPVLLVTHQPRNLLPCKS